MSRFPSVERSNHYLAQQVSSCQSLDQGQYNAQSHLLPVAPTSQMQMYASQDQHRLNRAFSDESQGEHPVLNHFSINPQAFGAQSASIRHSVPVPQNFQSANTALHGTYLQQNQHMVQKMMQSTVHTLPQQNHLSATQDLHLGYDCSNFIPRMMHIALPNLQQGSFLSHGPVRNNEGSIVAQPRQPTILQGPGVSASVMQGPALCNHAPSSLSQPMLLQGQHLMHHRLDRQAQEDFTIGMKPTVLQSSDAQIRYVVTPLMSVVTPFSQVSEIGPRTSSYFVPQSVYDHAALESGLTMAKGQSISVIGSKASTDNRSSKNSEKHRNTINISSETTAQSTRSISDRHSISPLSISEVPQHSSFLYGFPSPVDASEVCRRIPSGAVVAEEMSVSSVQGSQQICERSNSCEDRRSRTSDLGSSISTTSRSSRSDAVSPIDHFLKTSDDLFPVTHNSDLFSESDDTDLFESPSKNLFPDPPSRTSGGPLYDGLFSDPPLKRFFSDETADDKYTKRMKIGSNGDHDRGGTLPRKRASSASGVTVVVAAPGTPCSIATFNIFKCDFCRVTGETAHTLDAHLVSSKHLSGSEFGARAAPGCNTELVYIARMLTVRNGRVSNKSTVIACPNCRGVFDDVFTCALHNKYEHAVNGSTDKCSGSLPAVGLAECPVESGGFYSVCPVIACDTFNLPSDDDVTCIDCGEHFVSRVALFDHWAASPSHQPDISRSNNPQIFLLSVCPYCQQTFKDSFLECARHLAGHFSSSSVRRTLSMDVKQVMLPLRREELPRFDSTPHSDGMRDEMLTLYRLKDGTQLSSAASKAVCARLEQLQNILAAAKPK